MFACSDEGYSIVAKTSTFYSVVLIGIMDTDSTMTNSQTQLFPREYNTFPTTLCHNYLIIPHIIYYYYILLLLLLYIVIIIYYKVIIINLLLLLLIFILLLYRYYSAFVQFPQKSTTQK